MRVQGAIRCYAVGFDRDELRIRKNDNGYTTLGRVPCAMPYGEKFTLAVTVRGNCITAHCGAVTLTCRDEDHPWLRGAVGVAVRDHSTALIESIRIK